MTEPTDTIFFAGIEPGVDKEEFQRILHRALPDGFEPASLRFEANISDGKNSSNDNDNSPMAFATFDEVAVAAAALDMLMDDDEIEKLDLVMCFASAPAAAIEENASTTTQINHNVSNSQQQQQEQQQHHQENANNERQHDQQQQQQQQQQQPPPSPRATEDYAALFLADLPPSHHSEAEVNALLQQILPHDVAPVSLFLEQQGSGECFGFALFDSSAAAEVALELLVASDEIDDLAVQVCAAELDAIPPKALQAARSRHQQRAAATTSENQNNHNQYHSAPPPPNRQNQQQQYQQQQQQQYSYGGGRGGGGGGGRGLSAREERHRAQCATTPCRQWSTPFGCRNGDDCAYLHAAHARGAQPDPTRTIYFNNIPALYDEAAFKEVLDGLLAPHSLRLSSFAYRISPGSFAHGHNIAFAVFRATEDSVAAFAIFRASQLLRAMKVAFQFEADRTIKLQEQSNTIHLTEKIPGVDFNVRTIQRIVLGMLPRDVPQPVEIRMRSSDKRQQGRINYAFIVFESTEVAVRAFAAMEKHPDLLAMQLQIEWSAPTPVRAAGKYFSGQPHLNRSAPFVPPSMGDQQQSVAAAGGGAAASSSPSSRSSPSSFYYLQQQHHHHHHHHHHQHHHQHQQHQQQQHHPQHQHHQQAQHAGGPITTASDSVCRYFSLPGGCYRGANCPFRHVAAPAAAAAASGQTGAAHGNNRQSTSAEIAASIAAAAASGRPAVAGPRLQHQCRFFNSPQGCVRGQSCIFLHGDNTAARQQPSGGGAAAVAVPPNVAAGAAAPLLNMFVVPPAPPAPPRGGGNDMGPFAGMRRERTE